MEDELTVGTARSAPGGKARGVLAVPEVQEIPVTVVAGARPGRTLLVMAGVHGGEYAPIAAAARLAAEADPSVMSGNLIVLHAVSPLSFFAKVQYVVPLDGMNLNRAFPGLARGTAADRIAYAVMSVARERADAWIDMHGGDLHEALVPFAILPRRGDPEVLARARAMAEVYGIPHLITDDALNGLSYGAGIAAGIPSLLAEAGGAGRYEPEMEAVHVNGVRNVMSLLGIVPGPRPAPGPLTVHPSFPWLRTGARGMFFPAIRVGDRVTEGQAVGELRSLFGDVVERYAAPASGLCMFLATSLALVEGDPVMAVATDPPPDPRLA